MKSGLRLWNHNDDWAPFRDLNHYLDRFVAAPTAAQRNTEKTFWPAVDVKENDQAYLLTFDLPGLNKEDINLEIDKDQLTISGTRTQTVTSDKDSVHFSERSFGEFRRVFSLPTTVDANMINAQYKDGVLTVTLRKTEAAKPRQIKILTQ